MHFHGYKDDAVFGRRETVRPTLAGAVAECTNEIRTRLDVLGALDEDTDSVELSVVVGRTEVVLAHEEDEYAGQVRHQLYVKEVVFAQEAAVLPVAVVKQLLGVLGDAHPELSAQLRASLIEEAP